MIIKLTKILLLSACLVFVFSTNVGAVWTVPNLPANPSPICTTSSSCKTPVNVSQSSQVKPGLLNLLNPSGTLPTFVGFSSLFSTTTSVGTNFENGNLTIDPSAVLDVEGQVKIGGGSPLADKILTSSDALGLASWSVGHWALSNNSDLYNINSGNVLVGSVSQSNQGKLVVNGSISKAGNSLSNSSQNNLGETSTTASTNSTVGGGKSNTASGGGSTVVGGELNSASNLGATVGGGKSNTASGSYSTVSGGEGNIAAGDYSFAGGRNMQLTGAADDTFVWGTSSSPYSISTSNAFLIFPNDTFTNSGLVGIGMSSPTAKLDVNGKTRSNSLEILGPVKFATTTASVGDYLTSDGAGNAAWLPPGATPSVVPGESVIRISCRNLTPNGCSSSVQGGADVDIPPLCSTLSPSGEWQPAGDHIERIESSQNRVRTCYRTVGITQVLYHRSNGNDPTCPSGWLGIPATDGQYYYEYSGAGFSNKIKICYINRS